MEINLFFWLAIIAVYLFQFLAGKKKRAQKQQAAARGAVEVEGAPAKTSPLDDALSEISRMLTGEAPASSTPPWPSDVVPDLIETVGVPEPTGPQPRLGASAVFYDDAFEKDTRSTFHAPVITHDHSYDYSGFEDRAETNVSKLAALVRTNLHDRAKTREALVLAEVLGPPRSKQRLRPRG